VRVIYEPVICKICGSEKVIGFGHYNGVQRWRCKDCRHKFIDNNTLPGMRMPTDQIATALGAYFEGRSMSSIPEIMYQICGSFVTKTSIDKWVSKFSKLAINEADKTRVEAGDIWIADENTIKIRGKSCWVIDIIDLETRFLLAAKLSYGRATNDIQCTLEAARDKAGRIPKQVLTNGRKSYLDGIELAYGADVKNLWDVSTENRVDSTRFIEQWNNIRRARNAQLRRLKKSDQAQLIVDGWSVHYNYFNIQEILNGRTPARVARADFKFRNWQDLICHARFEGTKDASLSAARPPNDTETILSQRNSSRNRTLKVTGKLI
jgi:transposase-like protein